MALLSFSQAAPIDFARDVLPILSDNCFQCHGPDSKEGRKGDLRLDDEQDVKRDRDSHAVVVPGDASISELIVRVTSKDENERMPPQELGRSLTDKQILTLKQWIDDGAPWGQHWAFQTVERPKIQLDEHPVDTLVNRVLASEDVTPNQRASGEKLIRRLKLDLTGLPPTPAQIDAFIADTQPGAWERLIDRTLESPAYGERLAWDWLDAARYADSNGYQGDRDRTMWPWRDWVVRAFNDNLPFDQFTIWQLAGDLLPNATHDQILATGFNRNHMINGEGGRIPEENRVDYVMDMTETMGTVWLGLTLNCCRCHDHKFDPLKQEEYFQFTAFFNQTPVDGSGGDGQTAPVLEAPSMEQTAVLAKLEKAWAQASETLTPLRETVETTALPEDLDKILKKQPQSLKNEEWDQLYQYFQELSPKLATALKTAKDAKNALDQERRRIPKVMVMRDRKEPRTTFILDRGLYNQRRDEVKAAVPQALPPLPYAQNANRLALARWLVSRNHPLTARVTVNRFWQMLFGTGLVKTAEDFGVQAEYPVHRELLDWLAAEFMESGWDVKHLFRTIMTSETYQRSSAMTEASRERDPDNRLLARGPRFRMPSWMIRDQALAVSGLLNRKVGGRAVYSYQPDGVWADATFGKKRYQRDEGSALHRRSLYTFWRRIVGPSMFFDTAKRQVCEVIPLRTNTPMHALTILNDVTYIEAARVLAEKILQDAANVEVRMRLASKLVLGRQPSLEELSIWKRSLDRTMVAFEKDPASAKAFLSHGVAPQAEALPAVTHAAWTAWCLNLLNLDEFLTKE